MFQCKILNNILFLNKLLFKLKSVPSPLCSFCNSANETPLHIFYACSITKRLWNVLLSSMLIILQNDYGTYFNILFPSIFIFLKSLHRVNHSTESTTEFSMNQPFTTNVQALSVYVKRTWSCLFY